MDPNEAAFSPSRQATRAPVNLVVRLEADGPDGIIEARCNNLSIGGMFVLSDSKREAGVQMRFELDVPDIGTLRGLAEVVWFQPASDRRPSGLGFKFRYLEQRDRQLIFKLVSAHIKERLASRPAIPAPQPSGLQPTLLTPPDPPTGPPAFAIAGPPAQPPPPPTSPAPSTDLEAEKPFTFQPAPDSSLTPPPAPPPAPSAAPLLPSPAMTQAVAVDPRRAPDPPSFEATPEPQLDGQHRLGFEAPQVEAPPPAGSPEKDRSLGFSDLGGPAQPGLEYQGLASSKPDVGGPTILEDNLGDSLFGETEAPAEPVDASYSDYLGDGHFEHRPQPKKERPTLIIAALLILLAGALVYLFSDGIFDFGHSGPTAQDGAAAEADAAATAAAKPQGPPDRPSVALPDALRRLEDLSFRRDGDAAEVVATANLAIQEGEFDHFRLEGDNPREVVRLFAFSQTERPALVVNHGGVRQVRVGWHDRQPDGAQIHLVVDLVDPGAKVTTRADGRRVIVRVEPP